MSIGPVEYGVVAFPGNKFKGEIAPALKELVESKTIRILDLAFVLKDSDGEVAGVELDDANSSALVMVWEDLWATKFSDAVRNAGGVVVDLQRVPRDLVEAAIEYAKTPVGAEA